MAFEIVVQTGLGLVEFVEVDVGFRSEERIGFFASMFPEVAFCVLRLSGRLSHWHAGTVYYPAGEETGCKKKEDPRKSTLGDASFISTDFRLSLVVQHNAHRICGKRPFVSRTSKRHYATIARRSSLPAEAAYSGSVSDCIRSNAVSFL